MRNAYDTSMNMMMRSVIRTYVIRDPARARGSRDAGARYEPGPAKIYKGAARKKTLSLFIYMVKSSGYCRPSALPRVLALAAGDRTSRAVAPRGTDVVRARSGPRGGSLCTCTLRSYLLAFAGGATRLRARRPIMSRFRVRTSVSASGRLPAL